MDIGKDLQDAYERGRQDALNELMEYTYAMLTAEKFGLQHKIKSMMADHKTENSSGIPNNCEDLQDWKDRMWAEAVVTEPQLTPNYCGTCKHRDVPCGDLPCDMCKSYSAYEPKTEPQFDKDINVRSKDEPQTCSVNGRPYDCGSCEYFRCTADEPQTERSSK